MRNSRGTMILTILAVLAAVLLSAGCAAAENVALNETNFPDSAFREYLAEQFDSDKNGVLDEDELESIDYLRDVPGEVLSLQGIELLPYVQNLDLPDTKMTELVLEGHPCLNTISATGENLTRVRLARMEKLRLVNLLDCKKLERLELSEVPEIQDVCLNRSGIAELDLSECPSLLSLGIDDTNISQIDLSMLKNLEVLVIRGLKMEMPDLKMFPRLKELQAEGCGLSEIDLSGNPELTFLNVENNDLTALDLRNNSKLERIWARENRLAEPPKGSWPGLQELFLDFNPIQAVDVSALSELETLWLQNTLISEIDVTHNPKLKSLHVDSTGITEINLSLNPELEDLRAEVCKKLKRLDLTHNPKLKTLMAYWNSLEELDLSGNPELEVLWVDGCRFSHMNLSGLKKVPDPAEIKLYNNTCLVEAADGTLDLTTLKGFDVSRASDWEGGTVSGNILTFLDPVVHYTYDCGSGIRETFMLQRGVKEENGFTYAPLNDGTVIVLGCSLSGDVVIPETLGGKPVSALPSRLFAYNQGITSVHFPKTLVKMGEDGTNLLAYEFTECMNLKAITVDPENPAFTSKDGVLYSKDLSFLYHYPHAKTETEYHVPKETTHMDCEAFVGFTGKLDLYLENRNTSWAEYTFAKLKDMTVYYRPGGRSEARVKAFLEQENYPTDPYFPTFVSYGEAEEEESWEEIADRVVQETVTGSMSDREKAKALHDWITQHTKYSLKYNDQTGVLIFGEAHCEGYAKTYQTLLDKAGVTNRLVSGTAGKTLHQAEGHVWNQVKIGDIWYNVDVTWDDPVNMDGSEQGIVSGLEYHKYFLVSSQVLSADHYWDQSGEANTGWIPEDGALVFRNAEGQRVTGWLEIDGGAFWFDEQGLNVIGTRTVDGKEVTFESTLLFTDAAGDHFAGRKTEEQEEQEEEEKQDKPEEKEEIRELQDVETTGKTPEKIREQVQQLDTEKLAEELKTDGKAAETLREIESAAGGETRIVIAESIRETLPSVTAAGASLNGTEQDGAAVLTVAPPENRETLPEGYRSTGAVWFSMKLSNVQSSEALKVPVVISAEIPSGLDPERVMILHYHTAGAEPQRIVPTVYQSGGKWYARFTVTGFSDFALAETGKQTGDINGDGEVDEKDLLLLMRYFGGEPVTIREENADTNGDGAVDGRDALHLMKYLSGEEDIVL